LKDEAGNEDTACRRRDPHLSTMLSAFGDTSSMFMELDASEPVQNVDAVSGAFMLMPASVFALVSGFDEGFLLHAEDLDLCRRVRNAGYRVAIANELSAVHVRGVSSRAQPYWVEWQKQRSLWRYFQKYDAAQTSAVQTVLIRLGLLARFLLQAVRILFRAKPN
jgi:N-acetylglucosaminyl-diphospho-decaprenol L-rhamnosyltransferase